MLGGLSKLRGQRAMKVRRQGAAGCCPRSGTVHGLPETLPWEFMRAKTSWRTCYNWTTAISVLRIYFGDRILD